MAVGLKLRINYVITAAPANLTLMSWIIIVFWWNHSVHQILSIVNNLAILNTSVSGTKNEWA